MYADVHIRVDIAQKKVNVCSAETHLFTIDVVYTNIHNLPFYPIDTNPKSIKSLFLTNLFVSNKIYT